METSLISKAENWYKIRCLRLMETIMALMKMEFCCYRGGTGRTRLKVLRCEKQDYIDLAVCIACFAVILASRLVFPNY